MSVADGLRSVQEAVRGVGGTEVEPATRRVGQARFPAVGQTASERPRWTASDTDVPCHVRFCCQSHQKLANSLN